jgi:hypothetical protein
LFLIEVILYVLYDLLCLPDLVLAVEATYLQLLRIIGVDPHVRRKRIVDLNWVDVSVVHLAGEIGLRVGESL